MYVIPLGAALAVGLALALLFILLVKLTPNTPAWEAIEAAVAAAFIVVALLVFGGAFHQGPLYHQPPAVQRGHKA